MGDASGYTRRGPSLDDVVVVCALRTPMTKVCVLQVFNAAVIGIQARRGGLKDTTADELVASVLKAVVDQTGIDPAVGLQT